MRIRVTPGDLRSDRAKRVDISRKTYLFPPDLPRLPGGLAGRSPAAFEREVRDAGLSHVVADDDQLRVVADHRGNQHLYCHRAEGATGPELTITDDLLSFASTMPEEIDVVPKLIHRPSLNAPAEVWAERILNAVAAPRPTPEAALQAGASDVDIHRSMPDCGPSTKWPSCAAALLRTS